MELLDLQAELMVLRMGLCLIRLHTWEHAAPNLNVDSVSWQCFMEGDTVAMTMVLQLPPSASFKSRHNGLSR